MLSVKGTTIKCKDAYLIPEGSITFFFVLTMIVSNFETLWSKKEKHNMGNESRQQEHSSVAVVSHEYPLKTSSKKKQNDGSDPHSF